ncbi:E3 ubiquitin-protein ligase WAV3-like [Andrographis paniculata]|uniref:E3 ubiquitin-protein ligase WAV3-like n=1 Tax=Andrographis paniculata TaxID=175694 RepID=UPI0021E6E766|nr:E3 ubiquitin-protein ligase WAV3-like [Andrographis paniculata]
MVFCSLFEFGKLRRIGHWFTTRVSNNYGDENLKLPLPPPIKVSDTKSIIPKSDCETCPICSKSMIEAGQNLFQAKCSHKFHFVCIEEHAKNVSKQCVVCGAELDSLLTLLSYLQEDDSKIQIKIYPEVEWIQEETKVDNFRVVIHVEPKNRQLHAPIDLVAILDVSQSMSGEKIELMKQAMKFVINHLEDEDRLSIIVFATKARCLFPFQKMCENGRKFALQEIDSFVAKGATNMAEALEKGFDVILDRTIENSIASVVLFSDGQIGDEDKEILKYSRGRDDDNDNIPVHTFGVGSDHCSTTMREIANSTGGTFSFFKNEEAIEGVLTQCIPKLSSVAATNLQIRLECACNDVFLKEIDAGSHLTVVYSDQRLGVIDVGDLHLNEEKEFLVSIKIPAVKTSLLNVSCIYKHGHTSSDKWVIGKPIEVKIDRPKVVKPEKVSIQVDIEDRCRLARAILQAIHAGDEKDFQQAISIVENARKFLSVSTTVCSRAMLYAALDHELQITKEDMISKQVYRIRGRPRLLSLLNSIDGQRITPWLLSSSDISDQLKHCFLFNFDVTELIIFSSPPLRCAACNSESNRNGFLQFV